MSFFLLILWLGICVEVDVDRVIILQYYILILIIYFTTEKYNQNIQTYPKIRCASSDPAHSDIVPMNTYIARTLCKTYCTPAGCFTSHVEEQLVVAIGPMQHEIAVNSRTHNVIQCMNYMERTRKQDNHKKWVVLRERHRKYPSFGWNSLHW